MLRTFMLVLGCSFATAACTLTLEGSRRTDSGPDIVSTADGSADRTVVDQGVDDLVDDNAALDSALDGPIAQDTISAEACATGQCGDVINRTDVPMIDGSPGEAGSGEGGTTEGGVPDAIPLCTATCATGQLCCGDVCVSPLTDNNNCGGCGLACAPGATCCNGACTDVRSDPNNCGRCGNMLCHGEICLNGARQCSPGLTACTPTSLSCLTCRNLADDPMNCGTCGRLCGSAGSGTICSAGSCVLSCGMTLCSGSCSGTVQDTFHCGGCTACNPGETCVDSMCEAVSTPNVSGCTPTNVMCSCSTCPAGSTCCTISIGTRQTIACIQGSSCPSG